MKGKNTINMNQVTMKAAMQLYIDSIMKAGQTVTHVKADTKGNDGHFIVTIDGPIEPEPQEKK